MFRGTASYHFLQVDKKNLNASSLELSGLWGIKVIAIFTDHWKLHEGRLPGGGETISGKQVAPVG